MEKLSSNIKSLPRSKSNNLFILLGVIFLLSLGGLAIWEQVKPTPVEEIGLYDIQKHRDYQDSIFSSIDSVNKISGFRNLRGQYLKWESRKPEIKNTEEYNYYMLRLYSKISSIRFSAYFYDTLNKKMNYSQEYQNIYDSLYNYYDKLTTINRNHKTADYIISEAFYFERVRFEADPSVVPFSVKRNQSNINRLLNSLFNNTLYYYDYDTSRNKVLSRAVIEFSFNEFSRNMDIEAPLKDDASLQNLDYMGKLWEIIKKYKSNDFALIAFDRRIVDRFYYPKIISARQRIKYLEELKNRPQCYDDVRAYEFGREMATMVRLGSYNLESAIEEYSSSGFLASPYESSHPCVQKGYEDAMNNIESPFNKEGKSWSTF